MLRSAPSTHFYEHFEMEYEAMLLTAPSSMNGWQWLKRLVKPYVMLVLMVIGFMVEFLVQLPFELLMALDRFGSRPKSR